MKKKSLKSYVITVVEIVAVAGIVILAFYVKKPVVTFMDSWLPKAMAQTTEKTNVTKVDVSGVVRTLPKEVKAGIYTMAVEVNSETKDSRFIEAITSQPTIFRIGDKVNLFSIMPSPDLKTTGPQIMYYIAVPVSANNN
jgi:hypothetical protein